LIGEPWGKLYRVNAEFDNVPEECSATLHLFEKLIDEPGEILDVRPPCSWLDKN